MGKFFAPRLLLLPAVVSSLASSQRPISLRTTAVLENQNPAAVQRFLASPGNWPKIVTSSVGVESSDDDVDEPLPVGRTVDEIFGLPPILPLSVRWTCEKSVVPSSSSSSDDGEKRSGFWGRMASRGPPSSSSTNGRLEFFSEEGLDDVARNCRMEFDVRPGGKDDGGDEREDTTTEVVLDMSYEPSSPLATLAIPVLVLDNAVALKFLLPAALRTEQALDEFRNLMGNLYLFAGLAHLADCLAGNSALLTMAGCPTYYDLPAAGQAVALLWCTAGPLSFATRNGKGYADMGLIGYGLVEVLGAGLIALVYGNTGADGMNAFVNAVLVQGVVAGAWFYSRNKAQEGES